MMFHAAESLISTQSTHFCCAGGHYTGVSVRVPVVMATADKIRTRSIWKPQKLLERQHINFMLITAAAIPLPPQVIISDCNKMVCRDETGLKARRRREILVNEAVIPSLYD